MDNSNSGNKENDFLDKAKQVTIKAYETTAAFTKEQIQKADQKYHDPQFQQDLQNFKEKTITKTKELGDATVYYSTKAYDSVKNGLSLGWTLFREKYQDLVRNEQCEQQVSLKQELLKPEEDKKE